MSLFMICLLYFISGIVCVFIIVPFIHILRAIKRNHKIENISQVIWDLNEDDLNGDTFKFVISRVFGLIIWPIRVVQFFRNEEKLMNKYTQFEEEEG